MPILVLHDEEMRFPSGLKKELSTFTDTAVFEGSRACSGFVSVHRDRIDMICVDPDLPDRAGLAWQLGGLVALNALPVTAVGRSPATCVVTGLSRDTHPDACHRNRVGGIIEITENLEDPAARVLDHPPRHGSQGIGNAPGPGSSTPLA